MDKAPATAEGRTATKLALYVILMGWIGALVYTVMLFEQMDLQKFLAHFFSTEQNGIRFRALLFFFPMIATIVGYLVLEREKFFLSINEAKHRLEATNARLEEMVRQKDLFITRLGHDLKTPLTPLVSLLPLVRKREQDAKLQEMLDASIENVETMRNLVVKSLRLARVKSAKPMSKTPVALHETVVDLLNRSSSGLKEHKGSVRINIPASTTVLADKQDLEEVIANLLSNALKYSEGTPAVEVSAEDLGGLGGFVSITVSDKGIGLTREQLAQLFEEYYKADESRHELRSSGLGLAICKHIVQNHGGSIKAESEGPGRGTAITFTLPAAQIENEATL